MSRREPDPLDVQYTKEELLDICKKMTAISTNFYGLAIFCNNHAFIEFCGLMNKYIGICTKAAEAGIDFTQANTHSGLPLPVEDHDVKYLAEKFDCIFGPTLADPKVRATFIDAMGWGKLGERPR